MKSNKRACIAFVCGRKINERMDFRYIYDILKRAYYAFQNLGISDSSVNVYDCTRRGYLQGEFSHLYDYVSGFYLNMIWKGFHFEGYDYESGFYFMGTVNNQDIRIYDYEQGCYYVYKIC